MSKTTEEIEAELATAKSTIETQSAEMATLKALSEMTDAQKAHHDGLDTAAQAEFVAKSSAQRQDVITKAADADAVVYTSDEGIEYRKSHDAATLALAKRVDELDRLRKDADAKVDAARLEKRATDEFPHLPGDTAAKTALIKAMESITDETARKAAEAVLRANNEAMSKAFATHGTTSAPAAGSAMQKLEALAKQHMADHGVPFAKAMDAVVHTPEGDTLYAETIARKN